MIHVKLLYDVLFSWPLWSNKFCVVCVPGKNYQSNLGEDLNFISMRIDISYIYLLVSNYCAKLIQYEYDFFTNVILYDMSQSLFSIIFHACLIPGYKH